MYKSNSLLKELHTWQPVHLPSIQPAPPPTHEEVM